MTDPFALFIMTVLILILVILLLMLVSNRTEIKLLTLQKYVLVDKLRELGVHVTENKNEFTRLSFRYTDGASRLIKAHYYPSSWNLERQLDLEAYMARLEEEERKEASQPANLEAEARDALGGSLSIREAFGQRGKSFEGGDDSQPSDPL